MGYLVIDTNCMQMNWPWDSAVYLQNALMHTIWPPSIYQSYIVLLPKPGKDLMQRASYRPISLLNYDLKILTKLLDARLMKILPSPVCIDQNGFMPGKTTNINLRSVSTRMQLPSSTSKSRVVMLDIEKAFDSVDWA